MICPKCNAENEESSVFCVRCGSRLDGKKECPSCGHLIRSDAVYCNRCGARTDGKQVCKKCGTAYAGSFCPACGAGKSEELLSESDISRNHFAKRMTKTLSIITACLLFLSSFFIGYRMTLTKAYSEILYESGGYRGVAEAEAQLREKSRYTAIHYIVGEIEKISDAAEAMSPNPTSIAVGSFATTVIGSVIGILVVLSNSIIAAVLTVRLLMHTLGGDDSPDHVGRCLWSFVYSAFSGTVVLGLAGAFTGGVSEYVTAGLPPVFFVFYIAAICAFVGTFVFAIIGDGAYRNRFSEILLTATGALGAFVSGILMHFAVGDIAYKVQGIGSALVRAQTSSLTLFRDIFGLSSAYFGSNWQRADFNRAVISADISFGLTLLMLLLSALLCAKLLLGIFVQGKKRISLGAILLSGILFVLGIVKIVCDAVLAKAVDGYIAQNVGIAGAPIVFTVLAFLLFAALLTVRLIKRNSYHLAD